MISAPPPINRTTKPTSASTFGSTDFSSGAVAGAIYAPGSYPTPELVSYPLGRHRVLSDGPFTSDTIQAALDDLGPNTTLYLAQRSHWLVTSSITLQLYQELATYGYPTIESDMALLEASEDCRPYMFTCWDKSGIRIRNIVVDGSREKYGWSKDCGVMLSLGHNAVNQAVDHCTLRNPRNWSCIQAFEGSQNVRITNCRVGPAGIGADIESGQWADGISFAGSDGLVAGNEIIDATDGAIVIFGAPGTLVTSNTIRTTTRLCLGAINMVDYAYEGNYEYTRVLHNTIRVEGSYLKIGIGQGGTVWAENRNRSINSGGTVMYNLITSPKNSLGSMGYGYPVTDVSKWTCLENRSDPWVRYEGDISFSHSDPIVSPGPFVKDYTPTEKLGRLQKEFVSGRISYLIGIKPGLGRILSWGSGGLRLRRNSSINVSGVELGFDGSIYLLDKGTGRRLWELSAPECTYPSEVIFNTDGQLYIVEDFEREGWEPVYHNILPQLPRLQPQNTPPPDGDPHGTRNETRLVLSSAPPYLTITPSPNPTRSIFFSALCEMDMGRENPVGSVVLQMENYGRAILYTVSPYAQWVVLLSRAPASQMNLTLDHQSMYHGLVNWGGYDSGRLNDHRWQVVWVSPNSGLEEPIYQGDGAPMLAFQGDGNMVIYAGGGVQWASNTQGHQPKAKKVRYGDPAQGRSWIELLDEDGTIIWRSN